ncbi:hypothetical protein AX16_010863 [Volvariella volvacea WC 439]|nr:hypothetical protein AX16_010863 [Volvariella volvacea WC 439]
MPHIQSSSASVAIVRTLFNIVATSIALSQCFQSTALEPGAECKTSDKAQATVTLYITALLTIASSFTGTFVESFILAWISWLPPVRAAAGVAIHSRDILGYIQVYIRRLFTRPQVPHDAEVGGTPSQGHNTPLLDYFAGEARIATHIIWWIWHIYVPVSQWTWFIEYRATTNAAAFFARATITGVVLVAMSIDYKARVIRIMARRTGAFIGLLMAVISLTARWALLILMAFEYVLAALHNPTTPTKNMTFILLYCIYAITWGVASFIFTPGRDKEVDERDAMWPPIRTVSRLFSRLFFIYFTCTIALAVFKSANASNGLTVPQFIDFHTVSTWKKIQGVLF